jgi:hypothetical protein
VSSIIEPLAVLLARQVDVCDTPPSEWLLHTGANLLRELKRLTRAESLTATARIDQLDIINRGPAVL